MVFGMRKFACSVTQILIEDDKTIEQYVRLMDDQNKGAIK
jgi:hypothetical protein